MALTELCTWPGFGIRTVRIVGNHRVATRQIRAVARITAGTNIWLINPWAISARIEALPYIADVSLHRVLPSQVVLQIRERHPDSCIAVVDGRLFTIDDTQRILQGGCSLPQRYELASLPPLPVGATVNDATLSRLRSATQLFRQAGIQTTFARLDRDGGLLMGTPQAFLLELGDDGDLPDKVALINPILAAAHAHRQIVEIIDLRIRQTPVVQYRETPRDAQNPHQQR